MTIEQFTNSVDGAINDFTNGATDVTEFRSAIMDTLTSVVTGIERRYMVFGAGAFMPMRLAFLGQLNLHDAILAKSKKRVEMYDTITGRWLTTQEIYELRNERT